MLKVLVGLLVLAAVVAAAIFGARQIWFLGIDDSGQVALYRGLPYDLPLGIDLYSEVDPSTVTLEQIPEERRDVAVDHKLRSRGDAESLIADLGRAAGIGGVKGFIEGTGNGGSTTRTTTETTTPNGTATTTQTTTAQQTTTNGSSSGGGG